jgi:hypothetical protein
VQAAVSLFKLDRGAAAGQPDAVALRRRAKQAA